MFPLCAALAVNTLPLQHFDQQLPLLYFSSCNMVLNFITQLPTLVNLKVVEIRCREILFEAWNGFWFA